jgi:hypothetical protein
MTASACEQNDYPAHRVPKDAQDCFSPSLGRRRFLELALGFCVLSPVLAADRYVFARSTGETSVGWFPGLEAGGSFALDRVTPGRTPPNLGDVVRVASGSPEIIAGIDQDNSITMADNGTRLSLELEGRYIAFRGTASASRDVHSQIARADFSYTIKYIVDHKRYARPILESVLRQLGHEFAVDRSAFAQTYGTHYVSGANHHSYLRATYWIDKVDLATVVESGLTLTADGKFGLGSAHAGLTLTDTLKKISSNAKISVSIETNAEAVDLSRTIRDPSDVSGTLGDIAAIQVKVNHANPVPYEFFLSPWEDLLTHNHSGMDMLAPVYQAITRDYFRYSVFMDRLGAISDDPDAYAFLGERVVGYYVGKYHAVVEEVQRLKGLLTRLRPSRKAVYAPARIGVEFMIPPVVTRSVAANPNVFEHNNPFSLWAEVVVTGATNFNRWHIRKGDWRVPGDNMHPRGSGPKPSENVADYRVLAGGTAQNGGFNPMWSPSLARNDTSGWYFEFFDQQGRLVLSVPYSSL